MLKSDMTLVGLGLEYDSMEEGPRCDCLLRASLRACKPPPSPTPPR